MNIFHISAVRLRSYLLPEVATRDCFRAAYALAPGKRHDLGAHLKSVAHDPRHFGYIDAVRGLAFLAVLTLHASLAVGAFPGKELLQGGYGVQLFFWPAP